MRLPRLKIIKTSGYKFLSSGKEKMSARNFN